MRTFITLVMCLFLSLSLRGQNANNWNTMLIENWLDNSWHNQAQSINTFNSSGYLTNNLFQSWNATSPWENVFQTNYSHNSNGNITVAITQLWNMAWMNASKMEYSYDVEGKLINDYSYSANDPWQLNEQSTYSYDENDFLILTLVQQPDFGGLINFSQTVYSNNDNGSVNQAVRQFAWGDEWINELRTTYTYNAQDKIETILNEQWEFSQWVNSSRETYTYDTSGHLQHMLYESWNNAAWENAQQANYTNNAAGDPLEIVYQNYEAGDVWVNNSRLTFGYSLGTPETEKVRLQIVPNPAANFISILGADLFGGQVSIFDENGRTVLFETVRENSQLIEISRLQSGIYFVQTANLKPLRFIKN